MEQTDLFAGRAEMAGGRLSSVATASIAQADSQYPLAPPQYNARALDAGQMGIPLVRGVGFGVSMRLAGIGRSGIGEGQFVGVTLRAVPASQRANSRVRMGVFRSESAGAGLGVLARLS